MAVDLNLKALVLTTTPPFPRDYGNRNRVFQLIERLKGLGYRISLVLYPFDEEWERSVPNYYRKLVEEFEYFCVVPATRKLHQAAAGRHHTIDEWWDLNIGTTLEWLCRRIPFDVMVVNYAFLSRAFEFAPKGAVKVLETHDLFSGRREAFAAHGVAPEFFYTTPDQEKIAFDRSDVVIAIKDAEAATIGSMTSNSVVSIPYWDTSRQPMKSQARPKPLIFSHDRPLRVGFIGAQNSVNIVNFQRFLTRFERWMRLYNPPLNIVVAGNVCRALSDYVFLEKLGRVQKIDDFYNGIDVVAAPLEFSTGIKVKIGEALAWGKPVIATHNAFDGYRHWRSSQSLSSVEDVCDELVGLAMNESDWVEQALDARRASRSARTAQESGFLILQNWLRDRTKRIVLVTNWPFWRRSSFLDEHLAHMSEFLSHLATVTVISTADETPDPSRVFAPLHFVHTSSEEVADAIENLRATSLVLCLVLGPGSPQGLERFLPSETVVWKSSYNGKTACLVGIAGAPTISLSVLRYTPVGTPAETEATSIMLFTPEHLDDWGKALVEFAVNAARMTGGHPFIFRASADVSTCSRAFNALQKTNAGKIIWIGDESELCGALQIAAYRKQDFMIINRRLIFPSKFGEDGKISLSDSVLSFLKGNASATIAANWDTGWSAVWRELEHKV